MQYHQATTQIQDLLTSAGVEYKTFEHEAVRTSEEAAKLRPEYSLHQGVKALIVGARYHLPAGEAGVPGAGGGGERKFLMLCVPGDCKFNESKVKKALGVKEIRFATETEVGEITKGVQVGGVPPFGGLFNLPTYVDPQVLANDEIIFNAGDRAFTIAMKSADWQKIVNPVVVEIV